MAISVAALDEDLIFAQNVKIMVGDATDDTGDEEFTAINTINVNVAHQRNRVDHGSSHSYAFGSPDIELSVSIHATKDIWKELRALATRDSDNNLKAHPYTIKATSVNGNVNTFTVKAMLYAMSFARPANQSGSVTTNLSLLVKGDEVNSVDFDDSN